MSVIRHVWKDHDWVEIERYTDADVQDRSASQPFNGRAAILYAFSDDPAFYGDESEQEGLGLHREDGVLVDTDGDRAAKRIFMDAVISTYNFGRGQLDYIGVVSFERMAPWGSGMREVNEWRGGGDLDAIRLERWAIRGKPTLSKEE